MSMLLPTCFKGAKFAALGAMFLAAAPTIVAAEPRAPTGNIDITVGTSAGGTPDIIMRQLANAMNATGIVPNPIQVNNRTGGSWAVSSNYVLGRAGSPSSRLRSCRARKTSSTS
jgi:putative tricarboxylic transport membrane protein